MEGKEQPGPTPLCFKRFVYLKGRGRARQRESEIIHVLLVHFPNSINSLGWARMKPAVWNSICASQVSGGDQPLGPTAAFPDTLSGSWIENATGKA